MDGGVCLRETRPSDGSVGTRGPNVIVALNSGLIKHCPVSPKIHYTNHNYNYVVFRRIVYVFLYVSSYRAPLFLFHRRTIVPQSRLIRIQYRVRIQRARDSSQVRNARKYSPEYPKQTNKQWSSEDEPLHLSLRLSPSLSPKLSPTIQTGRGEEEGPKVF